MSVELTTADLNGGGEVVAPRRTSSMMGPPNNSLETGANLSLEGGDMQNVFRSSGHGGRSLSSPGIPIEDLSRLRVENSQLRSQLHQVQLDFQAEQDTVIQLKRRLNNIEKERLLSTAKANNEITSLESEATKLRAQLEKGEATRQNLEFELAKVRRDLSQAQKENIQKCESASETTNQMKEKISYLTEETTKLQQHIRDVERLSESGEKKLKSEIEEKEELLAKCLAEREIMKADRDRLEQVLRENDSAITELSQRLQDAETEKENNLGMLRRTTTELDYAKERGEHTKKELDIATKKIKSLEEIVEAERASHLESKFTSEIVQLRVRDLEGAVEVERGAQMESNKTVESLGLQIRHLQQTYEEQKKLLREGREKHERLQKEHDLVRYQLTAEVEDKKSAIQNLSKQLEIHQKNFNELRDELAKAKKRQIYLEETYGSSMREMELLVNNFCPDDKKKKSRKCDLNKKDTNKPQSASVLLGRLRHALQDSRKQVDKAAEETKKTKTQMEKVSKDNSSLKESVHTKNKAIEDTERSYAKVSRELSRVRSDYADLETLLTRMKLDLQNSSQNRDRDHGKVQELSEEIVKLTQAHRAENEEKMAFLHNLYQKLLAARVQPSFTDKPFPNFSWQDMAPLVEEEFSALVQHATLNKQQVCQLEEVLSAKEEVLVSLEREHTQQVYQLNALNSDREAGWVRQREQLETHYNQLITDIQSRSKKSQAIADQAWEKVRASGTVRQSLETECVELRTHLAQALQDNTGLQIAVSLLCGALYPLYARANALAAIRKILEDELVGFVAFKTRVQEINNAMSAELGEAQTIQKSSRKPGRCFTTQRHPLLTFRRGVITVMAANRLKHFSKCSSKMFVTYDTISGNHGLLVCAGGVTQDDQPFTGVSQSVSLLPDDRGDNRGALDWLTSVDLLSTVLASTTDLQDVIGQIKDSVNPVELRALKGAARACFTRLLDRLVPYFEGISLQPAAGLGDSHSLIRRLGKGLLACLQRASPDQSAHMQPYQEAVSGLKHHLLQLTERLHGLEVERRELLVEVTALRQDGDELTACKQHMAYLEDEIRTYREHAAEETVPVARFKSVCDELNAALSREEQAQTLMLEQSRQLEEFSTRLQSQNQQGVQRDNALSQSVQGLSETKADLKRKEQSLRQLNKTVSQLEAEKKAVQNNLFDAENALRTAAKDKEILATYITTVESAVNKVKKKLSSQMEFEEVCQLPKQLLSVEFIPPDVGKAGPELIACQNLVGEFVDTLAQSFTRLKAAETEGASQSRHITSLKAELSAAVRRDYQEQEDYPVRDVMSLTRMPSEDSVDTEGFYRLRAESDTSICETPTCRPKPRKPSPAKTHQYKTPRKSARPITKPGSSAFR